MNLVKKVFNTLIKEGPIALLKKIKNFILFRIDDYKDKKRQYFKDILFINGCTLPHPQRYRVDHQIEQLESFGISCDKVDYTNIKLNKIKFYRGIVVYRCPITPLVEEAILLAKENNKTVFYDIDDLVFDTKYTKNLKVLEKFSKEERNLYNDGVERMGKTLSLCEYGIASTDCLQKEMSNYLKEVYVNRNVASEEMLKYSLDAIRDVKKDDEIIILGYLSGSITHNDDFNLIKKDIIKILQKYDNVYLKIVGLLDLPDDMKCVQDKILVHPFVDWRELPYLIRSVDINLAPLETSLFNDAKSENKWTEAALVKIPTIASNTGAFKDCIEDKKTGILCNDNEWYEKLCNLIDDKNLRKKLAQNSYEEVSKKKITTNSGKGIADFISSKLKKNFFFVIPSTNISGGVLVALHHAKVLKEAGYDVSFININKETKNVDKLVEKDKYVFVLSNINTRFLGYVDTIVSTMWLTVPFSRKYYNCKNRKYLVQGKETDFYKYDDLEKRLANATYNNIFNMDYITISKWCKSWLKEEFNVDAEYVKNGIYLDLFKNKKRVANKKTRILIEGNHEDDYKNVDESFKIANRLDKDKYEIIYLSYKSEPKKWYKYDRFYHQIPHNEVVKIYQQADILLKTSLLESFSYPPLEMMATGGVCVLLKNDGNSEYIKDEENCLVYEKGNIDDAISKIERVVKDNKLKEKLIKNGIETAKKYSWNNIDKDIVNIYTK